MLASSKRVPLLATTSKAPKSTQTRSWEVRRIVNLCFMGLGVCGLLYVGVLQAAFKLKPSVTSLFSETQKRPIMDTAVVAPSPPTGLYALGMVEDIDGNMKDLSEFAGNVSIVVNVASHCGFTKTNYRGLQDLYDKYHSQGFTVLAFPCNQFRNQESDECPEIKAFVENTYHVTFPMFSKVDVNGPHAHPVFTFLKNHLSSGDRPEGNDFDLPWNFQKFLVGRDGLPHELFPQKFEYEKLETAILSLLRSES